MALPRVETGAARQNKSYSNQVVNRPGRDVFLFGPRRFLDRNTQASQRVMREASSRPLLAGLIEVTAGRLHGPVGARTGNPSSFLSSPSTSPLPRSGSPRTGPGDSSRQTGGQAPRCDWRAGAGRDARTQTAWVRACAVDHAAGSDVPPFGTYAEARARTTTPVPEIGSVRAVAELCLFLWRREAVYEGL
jgi:hypothetical protein